MIVIRRDLARRFRAVARKCVSGRVGAYYGAAVLLDPDDPARVRRRTPEPFFRPEVDFEVAGFVPNVVFPTGVVQDDGKLLVYYGAADTVTAVAEFSLRELLRAMRTPR